MDAPRGRGGFPAPPRRFLALPLPALPRPVKKIASPSIPDDYLWSVPLPCEQHMTILIFISPISKCFCLHFILQLFQRISVAFWRRICSRCRPWFLLSNQPVSIGNSQSMNWSVVFTTTQILVFTTQQIPQTRTGNYIKQRFLLVHYDQCSSTSQLSLAL